MRAFYRPSHIVDTGGSIYFILDEGNLYIMRVPFTRVIRREDFALLEGCKPISEPTEFLKLCCLYATAESLESFRADYKEHFGELNE